MIIQKEDNEHMRIVMNRLIKVASRSTCKRSMCGSIIWRETFTSSHCIGEGFNSMPGRENSECFKDGLCSTFKSDKTCCVHAEQRAIMDALKNNPIGVRGADIYFIRLNSDLHPLPAGQPYCTICSKMALDAGIATFNLWHEDGWVSYDTDTYNKLSFMYDANRTWEEYKLLTQAIL